MAVQVERLIATLEARIDKYEKSLAKARVTTDREFKRIETRGRQMETRLSKIGVTAFSGLTKGALGAVAPLLSVGAAVNYVKRAMDDFGNIADNAAAAGLDAEFFQSLTLQAKQGGVEIGATAAALATFAKNAGLAAEGRGKLFSTLTALDPALLANIQRAETMEARVRAVADALAQQTDAAKRAAIATAVFGESGTKLANVFAGGAAEIDRMQQKLREMGLIVDRDLIARADELGDKFELAASVIDTQLKMAFIEAAPLLLGLVQLAGDLSREFRDAAERAAALARLDFSGAFESAEIRARRVRKDLADEQREMAGDNFAPDVVTAMGSNPAGAGNRFNGVGEGVRAGDFEKALGIRLAPMVKEAVIKGEEAGEGWLSGFKAGALGDGAPGGVSGASTGDKVSGAVRSGVRSLKEDLSSLKTAQDEATDSMREYGQIGLDAITSVVDALADGKVEAAEFSDILFSALAAVSNIALPGSGQLVQALGGLFSPKKRAAGGPVSRGQAYLVGERRPELFIPSQSGRIDPRPNTGGSQGGGRLSVQSQVQVIDGNLVPVMTRISGQVAGQAVNQYDRALPSRMADKQRRFF